MCGLAVVNKCSGGRVRACVCVRLLCTESFFSGVLREGCCRCVFESGPPGVEQRLPQLLTLLGSPHFPQPFFSIVLILTLSFLFFSNVFCLNIAPR